MALYRLLLFSWCFCLNKYIYLYIHKKKNSEITNVYLCFFEVSFDMTEKKGYHYVLDFSFFKLGIKAVSLSI